MTEKYKQAVRFTAKLSFIIVVHNCDLLSFTFTTFCHSRLQPFVIHNCDLFVIHIFRPVSSCVVHNCDLFVFHNCDLFVLHICDLFVLHNCKLFIGHNCDLFVLHNCDLLSFLKIYDLWGSPPPIGLWVGGWMGGLMGGVLSNH